LLTPHSRAASDLSSVFKEPRPSLVSRTDFSSRIPSAGATTYTACCPYVNGFVRPRNDGIQFQFSPLCQGLSRLVRASPRRNLHDQDLLFVARRRGASPSRRIYASAPPSPKRTAALPARRSARQRR
jgi:hypothetical protein